MTSFRRKRGTYKVQEDSELNSSRSSKKKMMTCFVDLLDDNTMNIEIEVCELFSSQLISFKFIFLFTYWGTHANPILGPEITQIVNTEHTDNREIDKYLSRMEIDVFFEYTISI